MKVMSIKFAYLEKFDFTNIKNIFFWIILSSNLNKIFGFTNYKLHNQSPNLWFLGKCQKTSFWTQDSYPWGLDFFMTALCATSQIINLHANSSLSSTWQFQAGAPECQKSWWGQTYVVGMICSMTQLLLHTVAHFTASSFMLKANSQPNKFFLDLAISSVKVIKNWMSL